MIFIRKILIGQRTLKLSRSEFAELFARAVQAVDASVKPRLSRSKKSLVYLFTSWLASPSSPLSS